jgi:hypothetical protein
LKHRWIRAFLPLSVAAAFLPASAAQAASLTYIKQNNVWIANPDGSGQYQVTLDGSADSPYKSPSQADDGTIVALRLGRLWRMKQNGALLNEPIPTAASGGGPLHPAVSPNGRLVAFDYVAATTGPGGGLVKETIYSYTDRLTNRDEINPAGGFFDPAWVDDSRTVLFAGSSVYTDPVGPGATTEWFNDGDYVDDLQDLADGDVAGDKVALVYGNDHEILGIYKRQDAGFVTDPQRACYFVEPTGGEFVDPSLAPDATAVAWQEADGVWTSALQPDGCPREGSVRLIIAGGSEPDFGPANVNPGPRSSVEPPPGTGPAPGPKVCCGPPSDRTAPTVTLTIKTTLKLRALLGGLKVPYHCSERCSTSATLRLGRRVARRLRLPRTVATGASATATAGTLVLTPTRRAKRVLPRLRKVTLTLLVTARDGAGNATSKQRRILARR